jgi:septal ring factor EnvC (AmiA/AmiB activator)
MAVGQGADDRPSAVNRTCRRDSKSHSHDVQYAAMIDPITGRRIGGIAHWGLRIAEGARAVEHHRTKPEPRSVAAMSDVERLDSICRVLEEQCNAVAGRFATAEALVQRLRTEKELLAVALLEMERERDAAFAEIAALKAERATLQAAEQARRDLQHAQETALARTGLSSGFDEAWYLGEYPDVRAAVEQGRLSSGLQHYLIQGHKEQRKPEPPTAAETRQS